MPQITWKDGYLCVEEFLTLSDKPILLIQYLPIRPMTQGEAEPWIGRTATYWREGIYHTSLQDIVLQDGGKTTPFCTIQEKIKKPRGKQWYWNCGEWKK